MGVSCAERLYFYFSVLQKQKNHEQQREQEASDCYGWLYMQTSRLGVIASRLWLPSHPWLDSLHLLHASSSLLLSGLSRRRSGHRLDQVLVHLYGSHARV